jgi:hypothetical protein
MGHRILSEKLSFTEGIKNIKNKIKKETYEINNVNAKHVAFKGLLS